MTIQTVKLVGEPRKVDDDSNKIGVEITGHQEAILASRDDCPNRLCPLMAYSVNNIENGTFAVGAFCINNCGRLAQAVAGLPGNTTE